MKKFEINKNLKLERITPLNKHHFFGYYDKSTWDSSGRYFLGLETDFIDHLPSKTDKAKIILIDLKKNETKIIGETNAWNWQQGCMLQWLPPKYKKKIIYNTSLNGKFVSIIQNVFSGEKKILP